MNQRIPNFLRFFKSETTPWGSTFVDFYWTSGMEKKSDEYLNSVLITLEQFVNYQVQSVLFTNHFVAENKGSY